MPLFHALQSAIRDNQGDETAFVIDERAMVLPPEAIVPAAVLVAITNREEPGVLLTTRPQWLRRHAGQVALPGGRIDPGDVDAIAAALREAEEEIALPPSLVRIAGQAPEFITGTGFLVTPIIGVVPPDLPLRADPDEVETIFEAPLSFLLNAANFQRHEVLYEGQMRSYYETYWQEFRIWGVTAAILLNLSRQRRWHHERPIGKIHA